MIRITRVENISDDYDKDLELIEGNYINKKKIQERINFHNVFYTHLYAWPQFSEEAAHVNSLIKKNAIDRAASLPTFWGIFTAYWLFGNDDFETYQSSS